jgi:hypothetical protein
MGRSQHVPDTGLPAQDAQSDFARARRRQVLARLAKRLRREPDVLHMVLPLEEVRDALGYRGERSLGLQVIPLDSIVGTVDRTREFDRRFRPTSRRVRDRWQRVAEAQRRGEAMPPISVYRIGDMHFVEDGHHRVSVARAQGRRDIDAYVTEVLTEVDPVGLDLGDLPLKSHKRVFYERVPIPREERSSIQLADPWDYAQLAESVEAWGFRTMHCIGQFITRDQVAEAWLREDYEPIVETLREADMIGDDETETEAYMHVVADRYRLMRTHEWDAGVIERLRREAT